MNYKQFPLGALWTNGYLFWDDETREAFFADPGGSTQEVRDFLEENGLKLTMIILTHGHIDHIAGIPELVPFVGGEIYIGRRDAFMLKHPSSQLQALLGVHCAGVSDFKTVDEGQVIDFPGYTIKVMETPGHTEGSVCYIITDKDGHKVMLSGDTLFAQSVGRTDLEGGDQLKLEASLRRLDTLPDSLHVLPGHGPDTSIAAEREMNPYWQR